MPINYCLESRHIMTRSQHSRRRQIKGAAVITRSPPIRHQHVISPPRTRVINCPECRPAAQTDNVVGSAQWRDRPPRRTRAPNEDHLASVKGDDRHVENTNGGWKYVSMFKRPNLCGERSHGSVALPCWEVMCTDRAEVKHIDQNLTNDKLRKHCVSVFNNW